MADAASGQTLVDEVASVSWYHSLPLPGGLVTPGSFDNLDELGRIPFPPSLEGRRCLDVATADGFWAFEMERRGAEEVVAIDVRRSRMDWPGSASAEARAEDAKESYVSSFNIAHNALGSNVQWQELSVYELNSETVGEFDFVFMGSI